MKLNGSLRRLRTIGTTDQGLLDVLLEPLRHVGVRHEPLSATLPRLYYFSAQRIVDALTRHGLHALWLHTVDREGLIEQIPPALEEMFGHLAKLELARALNRQAALDTVAAALEVTGVEWVVLKGMHLGRVLYGDAGIRPSQDIDILVKPAQREAALEAIRGAGFATRDSTSTHEVSLQGHDTWIDLHWHLLRPGRAREELNGFLLEKRVQLDKWWVPSDDATTLVLLVHPAFTEHVTASLNKAVDLDRWLRAHADAAEGAVDTLSRTGLRTAAWSMLEWTRLWMHTPVKTDVLQALAPSPARQAYLRAWLALGPGSRYLRWPNVVRGAFSLALQDHWTDAVRAVVARTLAGSREQ